MRRFSLILLFFAALSACAKTEESVVAHVGNAVITESEFRRKLAEVAPDYQNYVMTPHGRRQFLDVLIREKMILQAARGDGVGASPEFKDRMRSLRKDEARKLAEARDYLLTRLWLDRLREKGVLKVTDEDVRAFHRKHPKEVQVRHILLPTAEEAESVLKRLRREGKSSFAAIAKKSSLDADTAAAGGQMRPQLFGEIIPELEVVYKMRVGELGGPVRSNFGYHILLKEKERRTRLSKVRERIREIIEKQRLDEHLKSLQASFPVEVVDAQFK
ncbi:MAG: peptidylprolyl isomerase [Elusimicrobiota bacterium]